MISNICLSGYLTAKIVEGKFRYINIDRTPIREREVTTDTIPLAYWNPSPNARMLHLKEGTLVMVTGRLERDDKVGLYVMCERIEYISNGEGVEKVTIM